MKYAIIYLHGFNSASLDLAGQLLVSKQKLAVLQDFCQQKNIRFYTPNVDYRDFKQVTDELLASFKEFEREGYSVLFMGSSLGGFTSEYMAMQTQAKAIMINPAIFPSKSLIEFIGVEANFETGQAYDWQLKHCQQYSAFENELKATKNVAIERAVFLDMADEFLDSKVTQAHFKNRAAIFTYPGGSHSFEHMKLALPEIENIIYS